MLSSQLVVLDARPGKRVFRLRRYLVNLSSKMVRTCIVMLVAVIFTGPAIDALKLPTYLRPCSRNDPNLNECILKVAREGAPSIIKGDRKYNIPVLNPLYIKELRVEDTSSTQTATLNIVLQDLYLHGLTEANIVAIKLDLKAKNLEIDLSLPTFFINFKYEINGKILVLPINGKGDGTLNLTNTNIQMHLDYDFVKKGDETVYASVTGNKLDFSIGNLVVYLDNLFNGDKALGDNTNTFLNENWEILAKDLGPFIAEGIAAAIKQIAAGLMDKVPYDDLLPEKL